MLLTTTCTLTSVCFCSAMVIVTCFIDLFSVFIYHLQLHDEYEKDKQQALERISSEVERSITHMRTSIERAYERQRDELIDRLEMEQKDRLSAVKRLQWVRVILLFLVEQEAQHFIIYKCRYPKESHKI